MLREIGRDILEGWTRCQTWEHVFYISQIIFSLAVVLGVTVWGSP